LSEQIAIEMRKILASSWTSKEIVGIAFFDRRGVKERFLRLCHDLYDTRWDLVEVGSFLDIIFAIYKDTIIITLC
jgi:hypothetical protein